MEFVPKKLYYKIGEVCRLLGLEAHVLRYWEREFSALSPPKSRTGHRTYRPKDIELLIRIRKLLYEEGFTIEGARRQLGVGKPRRAAAPGRAVAPARRRTGRPEPIAKVREELQNILTLLDRE